MATFATSPDREDPYKNFKFCVFFGAEKVAGMTKMSPLKRTTEVVKHRAGGDPSSSRKSPGRTEYEPITFERGVTQNAAFEAWANLVWDYRGGEGGEMSLTDFRREVRIVIYNEAGGVALAYNVHRCWVSEYQALPDFDANANAVAIQMIKIENEGWERDPDLVEVIESAGATG